MKNNWELGTNSVEHSFNKGPKNEFEFTHPGNLKVDHFIICQITLENQKLCIWPHKKTIFRAVSTLGKLNPNVAPPISLTLLRYSYSMNEWETIEKWALHLL